MVSNQKVSGTATTIPAGILLGLLASLLVTLIGCAVAAYLISSEVTAQNSVGYLSATTLVLGAAVGAIVSTARIKRMRVQICILSGVCYYLMLLAMTALFFGGQYEGMGATAVAVFCGCGAVALTGLKGNKSGGRRMRKVRSR